MAYRALRWLIRGLLAVFYRRIEVDGAGRLPLDGPLIIAANHWNALVDPMVLMAACPRRLVPLAKAPLFRHPLIGPLLRLAGALPVHRRQESGPDPVRNEATFRAAATTLDRGGALMIFPEGVSQAEPALMALRTGAARMLLAAEARAGDRPGVTLLPVGLTFDRPATFRTGRALVLFGAPIPTADVIARHATEPEAAVRALTERLTDALRGLIVEAEDRDTLRLLRVVEGVARDDRATRADEATRVAWMRGAMRAYRRLRTSEPERLARLRGEVERFAKDLDLAGLAADRAPRRVPAAVALRYALREGLSLVGGLPLALLGVAIHALPYQVVALGVRLTRPEPDVEATYKLLGGMLIYPLCWAGQAWLAWRFGGGWALTLVLAAIVPTGFFALTWRERLARYVREARAYLRFLGDRDLPQRLAERRAALAAELGTLARLP